MFGILVGDFFGLYIVVDEIDFFEMMIISFLENVNWFVM